jgi:protein-cysteine N-palmitoyltransferase HHAT
MVAALHGTSAIKILLILYGNYTISKVCQGKKAAPILTWIFNGAVLYLNEVYAGYKFGSLHESFGFLVSSLSFQFYILT